jgi:hypothetical protein
MILIDPMIEDIPIKCTAKIKKSVLDGVCGEVVDKGA